jgi:hypothetical protein
MSFKENINFIKEQIITNDTFMEKFIQIEKFYIKNKKILMLIILILTVTITSLLINNYINNNNIEKSNTLFNKFLNDNNNKTILSELKNKSYPLYQIAKYIKLKDNNSKDNSLQDNSSVDIKFLNEILDYKKAIKEQNIKELTKLSLNSDFLLKDLLIFNKALILAKNKQYYKSQSTLKLISSQSQVNEFKLLLKHYLINKID